MPGSRSAGLWLLGVWSSPDWLTAPQTRTGAIETLLRDEEWRAKSDRWVADVVKVHHATVASLREELYPAKQLDNYPVDNATQPRRVESQDGKTRTVPQRQAKPPEPEPVPVVTEEPIAAPRQGRS